MRRLSGPAAALFAVLACAAAARADDGPVSHAACIATSLRGQELRAAGRWTEARKAFAECTATECPAMIRHDCAEWTAETDAATPTAVFGAQDDRGRDVSDARIVVDGVDVTDRATGRSMPLDPGKHVIRYTRPGGAAVEQSVVLLQGEKDRRVVATFPPEPLLAAPPEVHAATPDPAAPALAQPSGDSRNRVAAIALGASGLALVAVGAVFTVVEANKTSSLESGCSNGSCRPALANPSFDTLDSQVATVNTYRALAGVSFGVGAAALAGAAYFQFARPLHRSDDRPAAELVVAPWARGGVVGYRVRF